MDKIKPLLATAVEDFDALRFPFLASPTLDGIRCLTIPTNDPSRKCAAVSRNLKPIPNCFVRQWLEANLPPGFDGELMVHNAAFNEVSSGIMSRDGEPDFVYHVFDYLSSYEPSGLAVGFSLRLANVRDRLSVYEEWALRVKLVEHVIVRNQDDLDGYETACLSEGYEGVMLRDPAGPYKLGRSTEREHILLKVKRFDQSEALVIGTEELMHNGNEATFDAFGHTKRSSHKANKVGMNTLGSLVCKTPDGIEFKIGTGFNEDLRKKLWISREGLPGLTVTYKHQPSGAKEAPRFPVFIGFRHENDIS